MGSEAFHPWAFIRSELFGSFVGYLCSLDAIDFNLFIKDGDDLEGSGGGDRNGNGGEEGPLPILTLNTKKGQQSASAVLQRIRQHLS